MTDKEVAKLLLQLEKFNIKTFDDVKAINSACAQLNRHLPKGDENRSIVECVVTNPLKFKLVDNGAT